MSHPVRPALAAGLALLLVAGTARAADGELRTFAVSVDGKPAGTFKMAVRVEDDGTETVAAVADVRVTSGLLSYTYKLQSLEVWRGGRLASVEAYADDDGKKHALKVAAAEGGLTLTADGKTRRVRADVLTTTGWRHPGPTGGPREVVVLDTEDGSETLARLEPLPPARVTVGGAAIDAQRFRLSGKDLDAEWWFDPAGRPVRQQMKWDGHTVVLELSGISK